MRGPLAAAVLLLAAAGCGRPAPATFPPYPPASALTDPWYGHAPPGDSSGITWLPEDRIAPVVAPLLDEALAKLEAVPIVRLTEPEATRLVGRPLPGEGEYVLLRAVVLRETNCGYSVAVDGDAVHVVHYCLGVDTTPPPLLHRAVVAVLPRVPTRAYATVGAYP